MFELYLILLPVHIVHSAGLWCQVSLCGPNFYWN